MNTQDLICLLLCQEFDKAIRVEVRLCPRVGCKDKLSNVVFDTFSLEVLFGLAYPGNLGVGVDDRRDGRVVDVAVAVLDVLDGGDTWEKRGQLSDCDRGERLNLLPRLCVPTWVRMSRRQCT